VTAFEISYIYAPVTSSAEYTFEKVRALDREAQRQSRLQQRNTSGQPECKQRFDPPFAASYFNWLFYYTYGAFTSAICSLLRLEPVLVRA
jgi:hypothetical protein